MCAISLAQPLYPASSIRTRTCSSWGALLDQVNLTGVATIEQAIELIAERAATVPAGEWIIGSGWDEGAWGRQLPGQNAAERARAEPPCIYG